MATTIKDLRFSIYINNDNAKKALMDLQSQSLKLKDELSLLEQAGQKDTKLYKDKKKALDDLKISMDDTKKQAGLYAMSLNDLRKLANRLKAEYNYMVPNSEQQKKAAADLKVVQTRIDELSGKAKEAKDSLSKMAGGGSKLAGALQVFAGNMMTKAISFIGEMANKAKEFIREGIAIAGQAEGIQTAFNKLNQPDLLGNLRKDTKGLVTDFQLMQSAVKANNFNIPLQNLGSLLKFAQQRAQETGESVEYLSQSIIMGIGRKSPLILDNLGIAVSKVQKRVKKTGDFTQAVLEIVNEELTKQGDLALTSADKATQASVKWENAQLKVGQKMQWLGNLWNSISGGMADAVAGLFAENKSLKQQYEDQILKVADLEVNTSNLAKRYDELKSKTILSKEEQAELTKVMNILYNTVPGVATEFDQYGNVLALNTQKVWDFIEAEKAKLSVMHQKSIEEQTKQLKKYTEEYEKYKKLKDAIDKGETLTKWQGGPTSVSSGAAGGSFVPLSEKELDDIKKNEAKYKGLILGTEKWIEDMNGTTIENQIKTQKESIEKRNEFNAMTKKQLDDWIKDRKNAESKYLDIAKSTYSSRFGSGETAPDNDKAAKQREKLNNELKELETNHLKAMAAIKKRYVDGDIKTEYEYNQAILTQEGKFDEDRKKNIQDLLDTVLTDKSVRIEASKQIAEIDKKELDRQIKQLEKIKKILADANPAEAEKKAYDERLREVGLFNVAEENMTEEQKKVLKELEEQHNENMRKLSSKEATRKLKALETEQATAVAALNSRRIKEKMSEQQYKDELLKIELEFIKKKLAINGISPEQTEQLNQAATNKTSGNETDKETTRQSVLSKYGMADLKSQKEAELEMIKYYEDQRIITEEEAAEIRRKIESDYLEEKISKYAEVNDKIQSFTGNLSNAIQGFQEAEEMATERKYDKLIKAAGKNKKQVEKLEEQKEKELSAIRAKNADKQFILTVAQVISSTALAAMQSYNAMAAIPVVGPVLGAAAAAAAIAYGASQIAVAREQQQAAKAGYKLGGYTGGSDPDEVRGYFPDGSPYHGKEFVATAEATANPEVKKFLDVFDVAQKNGTIRMLNTTQILEKAKLTGGYKSGGYVSDQQETSSTAPIVYTPDTSKMEEIYEKLLKRLDEPIEAYSVISGRTGSYERTREYEQLMKNAHRA